MVPRTSFLSGAVRVLAALAVAVPLGPGGICCCVVHPHRAAETVARPAPVRSCCAESATAPAEAPARPAHRRFPMGDDCGCPQREAAVLASAADAAPVLSVIAALPGLAAAGCPAFVLPAGPARLLADCPAPVPKQPLFRTLSALRC